MFPAAYELRHTCLQGWMPEHAIIDVDEGVPDSLRPAEIRHILSGEGNDSERSAPYSSYRTG